MVNILLIAFQLNVTLVSNSVPTVINALIVMSVLPTSMTVVMPSVLIPLAMFDVIFVLMDMN